MLRGLRFWYRAVRLRPGTTESLPKPTRGIRFGVLAIPIVVAVAALVPACASSEGSEIGSCPIRPGADCAGNYMKGVHLEYSTLFDANLDHADLTGASLASANLAGATIREAQLARATLTDAQLGYADLSGANLTGADLTGAILTDTNFFGARVTRTRFVDTTLCRTIMPDGTIANPTCELPAAG
jgi:FlaG/FlaF family flagellin (archaellin)